MDEFAALAESHRRELHVHCYRMLGSFDDAEDVVQETLLRAWRARETLERSENLRAAVAAASYLRAPGDDSFRAFKLDVLRISDGKVAEVTTFGADHFELFGLPPMTFPPADV